MWGRHTRIGSWQSETMHSFLFLLQALLQCFRLCVACPDILPSCDMLCTQENSHSEQQIARLQMWNRRENAPWAQHDDSVLPHFMHGPPWCSTIFFPRDVRWSNFKETQTTWCMLFCMLFCFASLFSLLFVLVHVRFRTQPGSFCSRGLWLLTNLLTDKLPNDLIFVFSLPLEIVIHVFVVWCYCFNDILFWKYAYYVSFWFLSIYICPSLILYRSIYLSFSYL